jgi:hypothetical protein
MSDDVAPKRKPGRPKGSGIGRKNKPGAGRPAFVVTDAMRETVMRMLAVNESQDDIALAIGCHSDTLKVRFRHELSVGRAVKRAQIVNMVFEKALAGNAGMTKLAIDLTSIPNKPDEPYRLPEAKAETAKVAEPKPQKLGKKEEQLLAAQNPDPGTPMGELMAARRRGAAIQ